MNFESWGFTDKYTFLDDTQKAFPLDKDYRPKRAYQQMIQVLNDFDRNSSVAKAKLAAGNGEPSDSFSQKTEFLQ